jgi:hypothetical protein
VNINAQVNNIYRQKKKKMGSHFIALIFLSEI